MTNFFVADDQQELQARDKVLFKSANEFSQFIHSLSIQNNESLTQTLLQYCEDRDVDPEHIAKLISKPLKDLLALEMQEAGLLKKESFAQLDI